MTCACGCGLLVNLNAGGVPYRYVDGHQWRSYVPANSYKHAVGIAGTVDYEHRVRAEKALGRPLPPQAIVHHADGSKTAGAPLVICENRAYHALLHLRMRIKAIGGDPNTEHLCNACHVIKPKAAFGINRLSWFGLRAQCKSCVNTRAARNKRLRNRMAA